MQEDLKILLIIQEKDVRIRELERKKVEGPQYIADLKEEFLSKQANLNKLKEDIKHLEADKKNMELDFETRQTTIQKYEGQLYSVKTNAEYKALESEIKNIKDENRDVEDKILEIMQKIEDVKKKIVEEEDFLRKENDKVLMEEQNMKDQLVKDERELSELKAGKKGLLSKVNGEILDKYNLIFENKDDYAIVPVEHGSCGGCFMKITSQTINELKRSAEIITCENCARILYYNLEIKKNN